MKRKLTTKSVKQYNYFYIEKSMTSPKATIFDEFISYSQQASGNNIPRELRKMTSENESTVNSILEGVELKGSSKNSFFIFFRNRNNSLF